MRGYSPRALWAPDLSAVIVPARPTPLRDPNREGGVLETYYRDVQNGKVWPVPFGSKMNWRSSQTFVICNVERLREKIFEQECYKYGAREVEFIKGKSKMSIRVDPQHNEPRALFALADFNGRSVLEIGCGDGRLTWRYADKAAHVTAIDPFEGSITRARENMPDDLKNRVEFRHIGFGDFAAANGSSIFDIAILSWSL